MAKLIFGMMQSLDGYVDNVTGGLELPPPGVALHRHFKDHVRGLSRQFVWSSHVRGDALLGRGSA